MYYISLVDRFICTSCFNLIHAVQTKGPLLDFIMILFCLS